MVTVGPTNYGRPSPVVINRWRGRKRFRGTGWEGGYCSSSVCSVEEVNPFRTAVPFWGQTSQISSIFVPKRDCGSKGVNPPQVNISVKSGTAVTVPYVVSQKNRTRRLRTIAERARARNRNYKTSGFPFICFVLHNMSDNPSMCGADSIHTIQIQRGIYRMIQ